MRNSTAFAMIVPTMFFVSAYTYPLCVNFVPAYRDKVDKVGESAIGVEDDLGAPRAKAKDEPDADDERVAKEEWVVDGEKGKASYREVV